jgi:hypothetical protein
MRLEITLRKVNHAYDRSYKPVGHFSGALENSRDGYESLKVNLIYIFLHGISDNSI